MRMRRKYLAARLPLPVRLVVALAAASVSAFENDFSKYPTGSQQCLTDSANASGCNGSTVQDMNQCLCGNSGNFVTNAAACIKKSDSADLETVYTTMADACNFSNTPLAVSQNDFMNAGSSSSSSPTTIVSTVSGGQATTIITTAETTTPTVTTVTTVSNGQTVTLTTPLPASTTSPAPSAGTGDNGMSSTAKIGIIAGAAVAGAAILAAIIFFFLRYRRTKHRGPRDESHPMLPQKIGGGFGGPGGGGGDTSYPSSSLGDRTSAYGVPAGEWKHDGTDAKWHPSPGPWSAAATTPTPTPHQQQQQWDAGQYHSSWAAPQAQHQNWGYNPGAPYASQHPSQPIPAQPIELAGPEPPKPVEMPASPMAHSTTPQYSTQYPAQGWTAYNGR